MTVHVLALESIHHNAHEVLGRHGIEVHAIHRALGEDELVAQLTALPGDGPVWVGIRSKTHVAARVFSAVPRLVGVGAFCIGTDQIDLAAARRAGVAVFNAPFSNTRSVAELVLGEIVMLSRQVFPRSTAAHDGRWEKSAKGSHEVRGKTLGIVGYGHIGSQLSILAEALGMDVVFYDIANKLPLGKARSLASLGDLLARADFVSLHVPDTALTRDMIGATELEAMRPGSYLVNASRGTVVVIPALRDALVEGHLAGAAVDVFPSEPSATDEAFRSPLQGLANVILTPHVGGSTQEAQAAIGLEVADAIARHMESGRTLGCVTLPELDVGLPPGRCRILNVHRNVPGVLSATNAVVAASGVNIVGQHLATLDDVALLFVDLPLAATDPQTVELAAEIGTLATSIRTRVLSPA